MGLKVLWVGPMAQGAGLGGLWVGLKAPWAWPAVWGGAKRHCGRGLFSHFGSNCKRLWVGPMAKWAGPVSLGAGLWHCGRGLGLPGF